MDGRPLVTIALTCYNRAHRLPETLASVFAQRYAPVEVIAVDDGSRDGTLDVLRAYGDRLRVHHQANAGVATARNQALRLATGVFVAFQDDDDLMPPDRLERLVGALQADPEATFAFGDWQRIDGDSKPIPGGRSAFRSTQGAAAPRRLADAYREVLLGDVVPTPHSALFRRDAAERIGGFDTRFFRACEDRDFFARLGRVGPAVFVPEVVSLYRTEGGSLSAPGPLFAYSHALLFEKHLRERPDPSLRRALRAALIHRLRQLDEHAGELPPPITPARLAELRGLLTVRQRARLALRRAARRVLGRA